MKKGVLLLIALVAYCGFSFAQTKPLSFNLGIDGGLPIGDWSEGTKVGIGGSLKGFYNLSDVSQVGLNVGYMHFGSKSDMEMLKMSTALIPIMADYRHHFNGFYIEPQAGVTILKTKLDMDIDLGEGEDDFDGSFKGSTTGFGYAIAAGVLFNNFDVSVRYQGVSKDGTLSLVGLRLGYAF